MTKAESLRATIAKIKREIVSDVRRGDVPVDVSSFGDLHDSVDANCYGGFCDRRIANPVIRKLQKQDYTGAFIPFANAAQTAVDAWIRRGGLRKAVKTSMRRYEAIGSFVP